jgi:sterol desaturase/sphingolipid hydroxylase (fatty acid hydroxylase superfamily)
LIDIAVKPLLTIVVIGFLFTILERLRPVRRPPGFGWARYATDVLHLTVGDTIIRLGVILVLAMAIGNVTIPYSAARLPLWLQLILVVAICDFIVWLTHRACHAVPFLWEFHKIHHSSKHLDWLAAHRVHPVEQIPAAVLVQLPVLLLGFSPSVVILYNMIYQWHAFLLHSNVKVSLGPLERVIATNRFHHWHHADHIEAYDRNFGAQLTIWDTIFGTRHTPNRPRPERFGVDDAPRESFVAHILSPFAKSLTR